MTRRSFELTGSFIFLLYNIGMKIFSFFRGITESHYLIVGLAFFIGLVYPENILWASAYTTFILAMIFFLSALKIDLKKVLHQLDDKLTLVIINVCMLLVLPVIVYFVFDLIYPSLAIAFLLLAVMPIGMTTPLLVEIAGGRQSLALILTVTTSLLAPFTVPFMIKLLAGTSVSVDVWAMFVLLATVIYVPFFVAQIFKRFWQRSIDRVAGYFKSISTILLGLLIMVIVAKNSEVILNGFNFVYLGFLFLFFIGLHFAGYFIIPWRDKRDRVTISVCVTYMNFTLAIELASRFFMEASIIVPVVLSVIPWAVVFVFFKRMKKYN